MSNSPFSLEEVIAKMFICRQDVKARQLRDGAYNPVHEKWRRADITAHLTGEQTLGHYLLNEDNLCKLFAFDVDFNELGLLPTQPLPESEDDADQWFDTFAESNVREAWKDRGHIARPYLKFALRQISHVLTRAIADLEIPTLTAYTGNKGVHVYGFTGPMLASDVRAGAAMALENTSFEPIRGAAFYGWAGKDGKFPEFNLFTIELFPKQDKLGEGNFGNLMRLPLGINRKNPKDPTFFVDQDQPMGVLKSIDPGSALLGCLNQLNVSA